MSKKVAKGVSTTATFMWNPKVACRTLDETAFILLNSRMVRLNEVGTRIWDLFEIGSSINTVVEGQLEPGEEKPRAMGNVFATGNGRVTLINSTVLGETFIEDNGEVIVEE